MPNHFSITEAEFNSLPAPTITHLSTALGTLHKQALLNLADSTIPNNPEKNLGATKFTHGIIVPAKSNNGTEYLKIWKGKSGKER